MLYFELYLAFRKLVVTLGCWGSFHVEGSRVSAACTVFLGKNLLCVHLGLSAISLKSLDFSHFTLKAILCSCTALSVWSTV